MISRAERLAALAPAVALTLVLGPASELSAQAAGGGLAVTLPSDSAEMVYLTELIQTALQPPVRAGSASGEFVEGRIYPFGGEGRYLVFGLLVDSASGGASWIVHPFGRGLDDAPSRILGSGERSLEVIGIGDADGYGGFIVVYCERPSDAATVPEMIVFDGAWTVRDIRGSPVWRCDGQTVTTN